MYAINIAPQNSQKCESCQNTFIEYVGTQAWCLNCKKAIRIIQQEVKVVPKMYQSNCKDKQSSAEIKIKNYLNEFCNKYGGVSDNEEMCFMYHQALMLKNKKGMTTKNYRENSAVVVFVHFKDIHRLSIKQFCKKNQIQQKSFNKSYIVYQKVLRQKKGCPKSFSEMQNEIKKESNLEDLKIEYTNEQESGQQSVGSENFRGSGNDLGQDERQMYFRELKSPQDRNTKLQQNEFARFQCSEGSIKNTSIIQKSASHIITLKQQSRSFLEMVFDPFFSSLLYKEKKSLLIKQLVERVIETYQNFKQIIRSSNSYENISLQISINDKNFYKYLFYLVLKRISHGISQAKYRKIIHESADEVIKASVLKQLIKLMQTREETVSFSGDSMFFIQNSGTTGSEFVKIQEKE